MATFLFAWELGGGLGHLTRIASIATRLSRRGHRVVVAAREVSGASEVLDTAEIEILRAPHVPVAKTNRIVPLLSFAHLLNNIGFDHQETLRRRCGEWRELYSQIRPDAIVLDHSPTALLAACGHDTATVTIGTGFCIPPQTDWLPSWRVPEHSVEMELRKFESELLDRVNRLRDEWDAAPFSRLSDLYYQADQNILNTFPELDHYRRPAEPKYWGLVKSGIERTSPETPWPNGNEKRLFGYLKPFPKLQELLADIASSNLLAMMFIAGASEDFCRSLTAPNPHVTNKPLPIRKVIAESDVVLSHGGHGTVAESLLAGKPQLVFPKTVEQQLTADNVAKLGAGLALSRKNSQEAIPLIQRLLKNDSFTSAANSFAKKHAGFCSEHSADELTMLLEQLCSEPREHSPKASPGSSRRTANNLGREASSVATHVNVKADGFPSKIAEFPISASGLETSQRKVLLPQAEQFRMREVFERRVYALPIELKTSIPRVIVDVGANVGLFSLFMNFHYPDAKIYCYEPAPRTFELLTRNLDGLSQIETKQVALGDTNDEIEFIIHPRNTGQNHVLRSGKEHRDGSKVTVKCERASHAFAEIGAAQIDILKIDTEGSEVAILRDLPSSVLKTVTCVMLEYHSEADRREIDRLLPHHRLASAQASRSHRGILKYVNEGV